jgi:hypothetical protein
MGLNDRRFSRSVAPLKLRIALALAAAGLFVVGLAGSFVPGVARAATGINSQINFQGRLLTNSGAVVADGNYNMRFKIYQDGDGVLGGGDETLKWTETRQNSASQGVVVKNGYFSVQLGSITAFGASVNWNQDTLWLSMDVTTNGTDTGGSPTWNGEMTPFKRLSSAVYAFNAGQLGGLTSGQFVQLAQGVQTASTSSNPAIGINATSGSGNLITLQSGGTDVFDVTSTGNLQFGGNADKTVTVAAPSTNVAGKKLSLQAGTGGAGATGVAGGNLVLQGGNAAGTSGSANGGDVLVYGGTAVNSGTAGNVALAFDGSSAVGNVGVRKAASASFALDVSGAINSSSTVSATTSVTAPQFSSSGAVTVQSGGSGDLTLTSASGNLIVGASTLQRVAAGTTTLDLKDGSNTTLAVTNSGAGVANLSTDGTLTVGTFAASSTTAVCSNSGTLSTCGTNPTGVTLQQAYDAGANATVNMSTGRDLTINAQDVATDPSVLINLQCTTCSSGTAGRFAVQNAGADVLTVSPNSGNVTLAPAGAGDVAVTLDADTNLQVTATGVNAAINPVAVSATYTGDVNSNAVDITVTDNAGASTNTLYGLNVNNADNGANTGVVDAIARFINNQATETVADGVLIQNQPASGTLTSGLRVLQNTAGGTISNGIQIQRSAGTLSSGLLFAGTIGTDITRTDASALTVQGTSGVTITAGTTTTASIDSAGAGTVNVGNGNATTIGIGGASGAATTIAGGNVAHTVHIADGGTSTIQGVTIGSTGSTSTLTLQAGTGTAAGDINIGDQTTAGKIIDIGSVTNAGTGTVNIATAAAAQTVKIGSLDTSSTTTIQAGTGNINLTTNQSTAGTIVKTATNNSTAAFQVQNAAGTSFLTADSVNKIIKTLDQTIGAAATSGGPSRVFSDGFESNNFDLWTRGTTTAGSSTVTVDPTTVRNGKYALKINDVSNTSTLRTDINGSATMTARAYVFISSQTSGDASLFTLYSSVPNKHYELYRDAATGKLSFYNEVLIPGTTVGSTVMSTGAWHEIELDLTIGTPAAGAATVYLDGTAVITQAGIDTGSNNPDQFFIGDASAGRTNVFFADDVVVDTVRPGDSASLNVADSLHVSGTSNFSGKVVVGTDTTSANPAFLYLSDTPSNVNGGAALTGNWASTNNWGIGPNSNASDNTLRLGVTSLDAVSTWSTTNNMNLLVAGTAKVVPTTGNDSATAFQVQNAGGTPLLTVDSTGSGKTLVGGTAPTVAFSGNASAAINFASNGTTTGNSLTISGQAATSGAGGNISVQAGTGAGTGNGGNLTLQGGTAGGTGVSGQIQINGPAVFGSGTYSSGSSATITQSVVDSNSTILATATAGSLTFTVPSPTTSTSGRILYIMNAGATNAFKLNFSGNVINLNTGSTASLVWNASASVWTGAGADSSTMQDTYSNSIGSTTPEVILDTTRNGLDIQDASSTIGATQALLAVRASAASNLGTGLFVVNGSGKVGINTGSTSTTPTISYDLSFGPITTGTTARTIGVETQTGAFGGNGLTVTAGGAGAGGLLTLQGGAASTGTAGSAGGGVAITGANGASTGAGGNGGSITITGGNAAGTGPTNGGSITLAGGSATGAGTAGNVTVKNATNATGAFQVQNGTGVNLFQVDTVDTNLVPNPGAEVALSSNDWVSTGTGTNVAVTRVTTTAWNGTAALQAVVSPATANAGVKNNIGTQNILATNTTYTLSFYAKLKSGDPAFSDISAQYYRNSTPTLDATCANFNTQLVVSTGWTRVTCTFTTSLTAGASTGYIQIYQAASAARTFYIDGVQLEATSNVATAYGAGGIRTNAVITSPVTARNAEDSTTAFQVQNAAGGDLIDVDTLNTTVTLNGATSGDLGVWNTSSNSIGNGTAPRFGGSSVSLNGYMYIIGGNDASVTPTNTVWYTKLSADGSVGTWSTTTVLPAIRQRQTSVTVNGYVYVIGGHDGAAFQSTVYYAKANVDGTLGSWQTANPIGTGATGGVVLRANHSSVSLNGYIYVFGGQDGVTNALNTVYYAKVNSDGSLSSWTKSTNNMGTACYFGTAATANGYAYYMGGKNVSDVAQQAVQYVKLNADGSTGAWSTTTQLPAVRSELTSLVSNGYLYAVSGNDAVGPTTTIYYNKIGSTGTLGTTWSQSTNTVPSGKSSPQATLSNGWFYYMGGYNGGSTANVYYTTTSRLRIGGALDLVGLQGGTMSDPGDGNNGTMGGALTAGNGTFVGNLQVQGQSTLTGAVVVGGNLTANGNVAVVNTSTTETALGVTANSLTTGTGIAVTANALTTGIGLSVSSTGTITSGGAGLKVTANSATTGNAVLISGTGITTGATVSISGNTASTLTTGATLNVSGGRTRVTPTMTVASAAGATWDGVTVPATTATLTGSTGVATATGFNLFNISQPTVTDASAVTVTNAASLYIANAPAAGGSVTITNPYALWIDNGAVRFDGILSTGLGTTASTTAVCSSLALATAPTAGTAYQLRDCSGAPAADYAENYPVAPGAEYGDVMAVGSQMVNTYDVGSDGNIDWTKAKGQVTQLVKTTQAYQASTIGIVSDNHGDFTSAGYNINDSDNPMPIALNGRVPVKVTTENGAIAPGDYVTTSATHPGYAMKATAAGTVIGQALESFTSSTPGMMMVFVRSGYWPGEQVADVAGANINASGTVTTQNLVVTGAATIKDLTVTGRATLAELDVAGRTVTQDLEVADTITTNVLKVAGMAELTDVRVAGRVALGAAGEDPAANVAHPITKSFKASKPIVAGAVVVADSTPSWATTTTTAGDTRVVGVAVTAAAAGGDVFEVAIGGTATALVSGAPAVGQLVHADAMEGKAAVAAHPAVGEVVGKVLGTVDADGKALVLIALQ